VGFTQHGVANHVKTTEALDKMKSYYDYQKTISNQSRDIAYLEQEARALSGVNNKAGRARLASIQNELQGKREEMADTKFDHEIELRSQGYDRLANDAQEAYERIVDNTKRSTELQDQVIDQYTTKAIAHYSTAYTKINGIIDNNGLVFSNNTNTVISNIKTIGDTLDNLALNSKTNTEALVADIKSYGGNVKALVDKYGDLNTQVDNFFGKITGAGETWKTASEDAGGYASSVKTINDTVTAAIKNLGNLKKEVQDTVKDAGNTNLADIGKGQGTNEDKEDLGRLTGGNDKANNAADEKDEADKKAAEAAAAKKAKEAAAAKKAKDDAYAAQLAKEKAQKAADEAKKKQQEEAAKAAAQKAKQSNQASSGLSNSMAGSWTKTTISGKLPYRSPSSEAFKAWSYIQAYATPAKRKRSEYSDLNKAVYDWTGGKILRTEDNVPQKLAAMLGVAYTNMKKGSPLYNKLKQLTFKGLAKGSRYVNKDQLAWTQEKGQEAIFRRSDGAMLTPLGQGDKVFTAEMTDNLWKLAKGLTMDSVDQNVVDRSKVVNIKPVIDMSGMDNSIVIQGNADQDTVDQIRSIMDQRFNQFTKELTEDFGMFGHKIRF